MTTIPKKPLEVFYSYAPKDELLREKLENHLGTLKRQGLITDWHHRELLPGTERRIRIDKHLATASIILLLISPDFISSDYCYSNEMARALEQHNIGKTRVIPIILRPTDYEGTPFGTLQALPLNGKPVTEWRSRDKAFLDIVQGIRRVIEDIHAASEQDTILDTSSQEYCHTVYEHWKTLDFKGILHINRNQPISIPLLDVFVLPNVLVGIPEYETVPRAQAEENLLLQELQEEYAIAAQTQKNETLILREIEERQARADTRSHPLQEHTSPREKHMTFRHEELQTVLPKHRRLVLLGDPGSGKSTLLRYMLLLLAQNNEQFSAIFPSIAEEKLALPLYLPLAFYADAWRHYAPGERSLEQFLERYLRENYLGAYCDTINRQLSRGKVLLLFDGLDEIPDASLRMQVARQVEMFTQSYPMNRFIITSRIVGYRDAPISASAGYHAYVLADFDEQQIKCFLQRWCPTYERWVKGVTDQQYLQSLATKEATAIFQSVQSKPAVRKLAGNPLLLTILALLQRQGTNLPAHRVELYDLCVTTLLDTWGKTKGISTTATYFTKHELIKILRPLAFWMHEHPAIGAIPEEELVEQVVKQLHDRKITRHEDEARKLAEEFLRKVRSETGILIERGKKRYGFLHLTFEEYLAAGELEQREDRKDFIKTHLHDSRWREVIQLTVGISGILQHNERVATELVRSAILEAESPFEHWLHRDLLLAGICLADDVGIDMECEDEIIERILCLALTSPYDSLQENISSILTLWRSTRLAEKALKMILPVLQQHDVLLDPLVRVAQLSSRTYSRLLERAVTHHYQTIIQYAQESAMKLTRLRIMIPLCNPQIDTQEWIDYALASSQDPDWRVREGSAELLGQIEDNRPEVLQRLLDLLSDTDNDVRQAAAKALGALGHREEAVIAKLLALLTESNWRSKQVAAETLGQLGCKEPRIREQLLRLLSDTDTDVRQAAIKVLWQLDRDQSEVIERLLSLLSDTDTKVKQTVVELLGSWADIPSMTIERFFDLLTDDDPDLRQTTAQALGRIGYRLPEIVTRLLALLAASDVKIRERAIRALGQSGQKQPHVLARLFELLSDSYWQLRVAAAEALGDLGCEEPGTTDSLVDLLSDPFPSVRQAAAGALGQLGSEHPAVIEKLLDLLYDTFPKVKQTAIQVLGQWGNERQEITEELLEQLSDPDCLTVLEAIKALESRKEIQPQVTIRLMELLNHPFADIRQATVSVVGEFYCIVPEVIEKLLDLLYDIDSDVRLAATKALKQLGNRHTEVLHRLSVVLAEISDPAPLSNTHVLKDLDDERTGLNRHITMRLLNIVKRLGKGHTFLTETLFDFLADPDLDGYVRETLTETLGELSDESQAVREKLVELLTDYNAGVRKAAIRSLSQLGESQPEIASTLLLYLFDYDSDVQESALEALQGSQGNLSNKIHIILTSLTGIFLSNNKDYRRYQQEATKLLKRLLLQQPETAASLLHIVSDRSADYQLKRVAAKVLGQAGDRQSDVVQQLLTMLVAPESLIFDQASSITALGLLGKGHPEVIETLLNFSPGSFPSTFLLEAVAQALGELGDEQPRATAKLFDFLPDSSMSALNSGVSVSAQQIAIGALGRIGNREPETLARLFDLLSHTNSQIRTSAIETLGQLGDGQPEIAAKFVELLSSTGRNERDAALIALAKQSKEPMQVMDILLKSLVNPMAKRTWESAISYILAASEVDRVALSQQLEKLLSDHESITKSNLTATTQVDLVFFALQQIVGNVI